MKPLPHILLVSLGLASASAAISAEAPSTDQDLKATIALHGLPCDQVVRSKRNADSDYTATCKDGNRYHVYLDAQGHVLVVKL